MDVISNKIAAYVIDKGTHAEWSFVDHLGRPAVSPDTKRIVDTENVAVSANALIFSTGFQLKDDAGAVELIVIISPENQRLFSFDNADCYTPAELRKIHSAVKNRVYDSIGEIPPAGSFRAMYRHLFGFDARDTNLNVAVLKNRSVITLHMPADTVISDAEQTELYSYDSSLLRLKAVLHEDDSEISQLLLEAGIKVVAMRKVSPDSTPQPIFWANGHFTKNANADEEEYFNKAHLMANTHLQTRYLNTLLTPAGAFCQHLLV